MAWYWLAWLVLGFGVPEAIELARGDSADTLSDTVWRWFGVTLHQPPWRWSFLHFVLAALMFWLFFHFVFRLFR